MFSDKIVLNGTDLIKCMAGKSMYFYKLSLTQLVTLAIISLSSLLEQSIITILLNYALSSTSSANMLPIRLPPLLFLN